MAEEWEEILKYEFKYREGLERVTGTVYNISKKIYAAMKTAGEGKQGFATESENRMQRQLAQARLGENVTQVEVPNITSLKQDYDYARDDLSDLKYELNQENPRPTHEPAIKLRKFQLANTFEQFIEELNKKVNIAGKVTLTDRGYSLKQ